MMVLSCSLLAIWRRLLCLTLLTNLHKESLSVASLARCPRYSNNIQPIILNPRARVFFGVLAPISSSNNNDICDGFSGIGVLQYETLRWGLERVNKIFGQIGHRIVHDSFVPGIQIGLKVYDTCNTLKLRREGVGVLFPETGFNTGSCPTVPLAKAKPLAMLDLTHGKQGSSHIEKALSDHQIPHINLDYTNFDSVEERTQAILLSAKKLGWNKLSIIVEDDDAFSRRLSSEIERKSKEFGLIVSGKVSFGKGLTSSFKLKIEHQVKNSQAILIFTLNSRIIKEVLNGVHLEKFPALVFSQTLNENIWRILKSENLKNFTRDQNFENKIFHISFSPSKILEFDARWKTYQKTNFHMNEKNSIIMSYLSHLRNCTKKPYLEFKRPCDDLTIEPREKILSTISSPPIYAAFHGLYSLFNAYKNAWKKKCKYRRGYCFDLANIRPNDFNDFFLKRLETRHSYPGSRSPSELKGWMGIHDDLGSIRGINYGFYKISLQGNSGVLATQILEVEGNKTKVVSESVFEAIKTKFALSRDGQNRNSRKTQEKISIFVPLKHNEEIKRVRKAPLVKNEVNQSPTKEERLLDRLFRTEVKSMSHTFTDQTVRRAKLANAEGVSEGEMNTLMDSKDFSLKVQGKELRSSRNYQNRKDVLVIQSRNKIYIAGLFPLHYPTENRTECSDVLNDKAVQDAEAFIWSIGQVNLYGKILPKTELGALVLDTCGSKIRTTNQITNLVQNSFSDIKVNISQILMFVTSLDTEIAQVTGDLLGSLNITSINLGSSGTHSPFSLKMKPPIEKEAEALLQIIKYYDWETVSLLVSNEDPVAQFGAREFKHISKMAQICIHEELQVINDQKKMTNQIKSLIRRSEESSVRVFVTFLSKGQSNLLVKTLIELSNKGIYSMGKFTFLSGTNWDTSKKGEILAGGLFLKNGEKDVEAFKFHYNDLVPGNSENNLWFLELWKQRIGCSESLCEDDLSRKISLPIEKSTLPLIPYQSEAASTRVIQSVFSFGAALNQLFNYLCPNAGGEMCPKLEVWRQRVLLNEFIRNTEVSRVDEPKDYFEFSVNFHGNTPLEILNPRWKDGLNKTGIYAKVGSYFDSKLNLTNAFETLKNGSKIPYKDVISTCIKECPFCQREESSFVFLESPHKIYVMAVFDVHNEGVNPIDCGPLIKEQAIHNIEALLFTLREMNKNSSLKIGAIVFDSCSSKEKLVNEISNFFKRKLSTSLKDKIPSAQNIVSIITGTRGEVLKQLLDITQPYNITTIATRAKQTFLNEIQKYPRVLKLHPSNTILAKTLVSLIELWKWELVSVVYSDHGDTRDLFYEFHKRSKTLTNFGLATAVSIPKEIDTSEVMLEMWSKLMLSSEEGSRVIFIFLDSSHELLFLQTGSKLIDEGILKLGDFVLVLTKTPRPFFRKESDALGSLVIQPAVEYFEVFDNYLQNLSPSNHALPYKWFEDYWSEIHKCNGALCSLKDLGSIDSSRQSEGVVETANAVRIVEETLKKLKESVCREGSFDITCSKKVLQKSGAKFFDVALTANLTGVGGKHLKFSSNGTSTQATLLVLNFQKSEKGRYKFVKIGSYVDKVGPLLEENLAVSYLRNGTEILLSEVRSKCDATFRSCGDLKALIELPTRAKNQHQKLVQPQPNLGSPEIQQIYPNERFGISFLIPMHEEGGDFFTCGNFYSESVFQNLVAAVYALTQIRTKGEIGLGAIAFDYCSRVEKAREQYFNFFSGKMHKSYESLIGKEKIVAAISFDDKAAESVSSILSSNHVPQFSSPVINRKLNHHENDMILTSVPPRSLEIDLYVNLIKAFKWKYVSVIYDNNMMGNKLNEMFRKYATQDDICISDSLPLPDRLSKEYTKGLVETLSSYWKPKVIVLLVDDSDNIRTLLEVFNEKMLSEKFVFLAGSSWGNKLAITEGLERISTGALTFTLETYDLPDFRYFLSNLTLENHEPIPKSWFEDYYQSKHKCKISNSLNPQEQYVTECTGKEITHFDYEVQDPYVYHTILSINSVAQGINSYIEKFCNGVKDIDHCKFLQPKLSLEITQQRELYMNSSNNIHLYNNNEISYGFHLWNFRKLGSSYGYVNIGSFKNDAYIDLEKSIIEFKVGSFVPESYCNEGICLDICSYQSPVYAIMKMPDPLPIDHNFKTVYGIITSCLSLIGIITILLSIIYFIIAYPKSESSCILGYFILLGCLMIYSVNFAFIFQATETTCSVRKFLMGFSYAVVYSSMFVKVVHNWRQANYFRNDNSRRNFVMITVCIVLIIIEVIVASAWLAFYPSQVDLHGELWRCSPSESFEKELIISLIYDMILIASTLLFCFETWHNREAIKQTRWILFSALCTTLTWIIWAVIATQAPIMFRDPSIVIGNIVSATTIILLLYARRFYIYSYLPEDIRNLELKSPFSSRIYNSAFSSSSYLGSHFGKSTTNPIREIIPGTQYVGDQEVSFRTVTLPPNLLQVHRTSTRVSRASKLSKLASSSVLNSSLEEDPLEDLNVNSVFESSEEEYSVDVVPEESDDTSSNSDAVSEKNSGVTTAVISMRQPSIKRVGSNRMLVFLTDGSSAGEISRI